MILQSGEEVAALPDSESDIMVVSGEYARKRGFEVDRGGAGRVMVELRMGRRREQKGWSGGSSGSLESGCWGTTRCCLMCCGGAHRVSATAQAPRLRRAVGGVGGLRRHRGVVTSTAVPTQTSTLSGSCPAATRATGATGATGDVAFQNFEGTSDFASRGWVPTGGLVGAAPAQGTLPGQQTVSGFTGTGLVNTFLNGDSTTGTLTSPPFTITKKRINFLIGGGNVPGVECINLKVGGQVVRTATGSDSEQLLPKSWDVTALIGQKAVIEIVDLSTAGWGHVLVDEISFSDASTEPRGTNWMDWGPDFYAAATFNGLPSADRTNIAWMSNWQYAANIPTSPWRSMTSIPRKLSLKTINGWPALIQQPVANWASLQTGTYSNALATVAEGNQPIPLSGKSLDITVTFSDRNSASSAQFGLLLRATSDRAQQTRIGYDFGTKSMFVDRTKSGNVGFDGTFSNTYYAPLAPGSDGKVTMRILLDSSSVEVFGGVGEVTLSAQIFPQDTGIDVGLFSTGGNTNGVTIDAKMLGSAFDGTPTNSTSSTSSKSSTSSTSTSRVSSTSTTFSTTLSTTTALSTTQHHSHHDPQRTRRSS